MSARGPLVVLSQRLGPVGAREAPIAAAGARIEGRPLWSLEDIASNAADADIVILGAVEPFGADALESLPELRAVVRRGVGTDNVDLEAATRLGIVVANVPDASVDEVAEHALALLLAIERGVVALDRGVRGGAWARDPTAIQRIRHPIRRLRELTLGIVGFGRIGRGLAHRAAPIYGRIVASDPYATRADATAVGVELIPFTELLAASDHLSVHAPLTESTRHLIDERALSTLPSGAIVVNTSRGGLVDEAALVAAVRDGRLRGAGVDVSQQEPLPPGDPLLADDRILLTGHSAASSATADRELAERSVAAAVAILQARHPPSLANPAVLHSAALRVRFGGPDRG